MRALSQREKEILINNIKKYQDLRVLSFDKDFKNREKLIYDSSITSVFWIIVCLFVFILLSHIFELFENEITKNISFIFGSIVILGFFYFVFESFNKYLLAKIKKFIFIVIPFEFWMFFSSLWLFPYLKNGNWMYCNAILNIVVFILSIVFTGLQFCRLFKHFPNYLIESLSTLAVTILAISSIGTLIFGPQILNPTSMCELFISWGIILITGAVTVIQICFEHKRSKNEEIAQQIFQEQLLKNEDDINYNRLVECYYYGGEKYKEKLLSTEKFLIEILKHELKLLKNLNSYENYLLCKAFYSKTLVASSTNNKPPRVRKTGKVARRRTSPSNFRTRPFMANSVWQKIWRAIFE